MKNPTDNMLVQIERSIEHIGETHGIRKVMWRMDERVENLVSGIRQGDDAVVVGRQIINMEGPYPLKTGRKTGLIHTCTDVVAMGGRPLYAFDAMQVNDIEEAISVSEDLKKQSYGLDVPILGGNTQMENNLEPCISFTVFGELLTDKVITDSGAKDGDNMVMLGEVVEGSIGERIYRVKVRYAAFMNMVENGLDIHANKDASRGGWFGNLVEMLVKAKLGAVINSIPYPKISRYMGVFLMAVPDSELDDVVSTAARHNCPVVNFAKITKEKEIKLGKDVVVPEDRMCEMIRNMPFAKARKLK